MTKVIEIDGKKVPFKASAAIPRIYRIQYGRDIFRDLITLGKMLNQNSEDQSGLDLIDLEIFENVAYIMAYHADPSIPKTIDEWLDQFEMFSIYQVLPQILELWGDNLMTDVQAKKGLAEVSGK